ncbi:MAG TPA: hydroxyisourate hydrolase [Gammaproteobacteria bacterium]|nr:hydroxyisourate hydrolase [Gammaproteobacteria bacterium]
MSQISCHVLDTAHGCPASGIPIQLYQQSNEAQWQCLGQSKTDADGRVTDLLVAEQSLPAGIYRVHFVIRDYLQSTGQAVFYPYVDVVFTISNDGQHYHIPLLLSPYGYSTYRGS